jgi:hypothetical protein
MEYTQKRQILIRVMGLVFFSVLLSACQNNNNSKSASILGGPRFAASGVTSGLGNLPGKIYSSDVSQQAGFQQAAQGFLSTDIPPEYLGPVNINGSGIRFSGSVAVTNGSLRTYDGTNAVIHSASSITIQVLDQATVSRQSAPIPAIQFRQAQGQLMGNQAQITFGDAFGSITFVGVLNTTSNTFEGNVSYDNKIRWDGSSPGSAGNLGSFSIPLCSFFVCH